MAAKPRKAAQQKPLGKSQLALARHLDVSQQRVSQFVADGTFPTLPDGTLDVDVCRVIYIRWLRDETRKSSTSEAAKRVQDQRASQIELQIAKDLGKLIPIEDVQAFLSETLGTFRSELSGVPAASTRDLDVRTSIEKNLNAAIDRCRASYEAASRAIADGKPIVLGSEEPDA